MRGCISKLNLTGEKWPSCTRLPLLIIILDDLHFNLQRNNLWTYFAHIVPEMSLSFKVLYRLSRNRTDCKIDSNRPSNKIPNMLAGARGDELSK